MNAGDRKAGNGEASTRGAVKSADRSLAVLELLAARPEGMTFGEITAALALPRSSAHGLLATLTARGYVELADPAAERERRYRLGLRLAELSAGYYRAHGPLAHARAAIGQLAAETGETCHLVVLDRADAVYLHAEESGHGVRLASPVGRRLPAQLTAAGKALLAGLEDAEVVRRLAEAPGVPGTPGMLDGLLRELEEVRKLGHAHDVEAVFPGVHCVAAPVRDVSGQHSAALSISVPTPRLDGERLAELARRVRVCAERASQGPPLGRGGGDAGRAGGTRRGGVRIGWAMAEMRHAFFSIIRRETLAIAPSLGADVYWTEAAGDESKQACDVAHLLEMGIDVLVLHPVHTLRADALFRAAAERGVPSICFRRPARSDVLTLFAGGDTAAEGEQQVEWVAEALGGVGNVVILEGDPFNDNARNIAEGNRRALARYQGLRVVADEVCPEWSAVVAERVASEILATGQAVDAFICANDGLASGAIQALEARGLVGRVLVVGGDGEQGALERIRTGGQHATLFHDPVQLAHATLRAAAALARNALDVSSLPRRSPAVSPPSRAVPVVDVPFLLVTRENVDQVGAAA
ncbi:MAG TPA: substrate-binding domain-containing protein [Chloroflexota bacterium]|nr:substrate-binding domain-containing protein [Chloroflexota bacterium]